MKPVSFIVAFVFAYSLNAQNKIAKSDTIISHNDFKYLYRYQNFYLGGQPTLEALEWFKEQGVTLVINLRSEKENKEYSNYAYNEMDVVREMGFEYKTLAVDGLKEFTPEKLKEFLKLVDTSQKTLIHCRTAGRVTYFFWAYLIKRKAYSIEKATKIGKRLESLSPLEELLETEINLKN